MDKDSMGNNAKKNVNTFSEYGNTLGYFVQRGFQKSVRLKQQFNKIKCMISIRTYLLYKLIQFFFKKISEIYLFLGHDHLSKFSSNFVWFYFLHFGEKKIADKSSLIQNCVTHDFSVGVIR